MSRYGSPPPLILPNLRDPVCFTVPHVSNRLPAQSLGNSTSPSPPSLSKQRVHMHQTSSVCVLCCRSLTYSMSAQSQRESGTEAEGGVCAILLSGVALGVDPTGAPPLCGPGHPGGITAGTPLYTLDLHLPSYPSFSVPHRHSITCARIRLGPPAVNLSVCWCALLK